MEPTAAAPGLTEVPGLLLEQLRVSDAAQMAAACRSTALCPLWRRHLASSRIARLWRLLRMERWVNAAINDSKGFHFFINRLACNLEGFDGFHCGLQGLGRVLAQRRQVFLSHLPRCPKCPRRLPVQVAVYTSYGCNMKRSHPVLWFGCEPCCRERWSLYESESEHSSSRSTFDDEYYQEPVATFAPARSSPSTAESVTRRLGDGDGEQPESRPHALPTWARFSSPPGAGPPGYGAPPTSLAWRPAQRDLSIALAASA